MKEGNFFRVNAFQNTVTTTRSKYWRDGGEVVDRIVLDALGVVDQRREDNDSEDEKENEKSEFVGARFERVDEDLDADSSLIHPTRTEVRNLVCNWMYVDEDLESGRVPRELEQSHDADDAEELEDVVVLLHVRQHVIQVTQVGEQRNK